jgi:hypothetical protein
MTDNFRFPEDDDLPEMPKPGLIGKLAGRMLRRALAPHAPEMMQEVMATVMRQAAGEVPDLAEAMRRAAADPSRYVPEPGQEPPPAEVIADPGLAKRIPGLLNRPPLPPDGLPDAPLPPPMQLPRSVFLFSATLEEDGDLIVVRTSGERIGQLNPAGAEAYGPHLEAARLRDQVVRVTVRGRMNRGRLSHVTVQLSGVFPAST